MVQGSGGSVLIWVKHAHPSSSRRRPGPILCRRCGRKGRTTFPNNESRCSWISTSAGRHLPLVRSPCRSRSSADSRRTRHGADIHARRATGDAV